MTDPVPVHPLRSWRLSKDLTLDAAAAKVGTTRQVWHAWETGRRTPSRTFMPKVLALCGGEVSGDDFFCGLDDAA